MQNVTAGFLWNKYAKIKDILQLKLQVIEERIDFSTLVFRAFHNQKFSKNLQLQQKQTNIKMLKNNNNEILIGVTKNSRAFSKQSAPRFNGLATIIQSDIILSTCKVEVKQYQLDKALTKYFMV